MSARGLLMISSCNKNENPISVEEEKEEEERGEGGTYQAHVEQSLGGTIRVLYAQQVVRDEHHLLQSVQGRVQGLPEREKEREKERVRRSKEA